MTVYSKTMAGRMAVVDVNATLPKALKTLLKSIDGKTSLEQLAKTTPDALQLMQALASKGLIEVREARWANSGNSGFADSAAHAGRAAAGLPGTILAPALPIDKTAVRPIAPELTPIKWEMTQFIVTHLPQHADKVLNEIEAINTYDKLSCILPAYANLAHEAGRLGLEHIKQLSALMGTGAGQASKPSL